MAITFTLEEYALQGIDLKPGPTFTLNYDTDFELQTQGIPQEVLAAKFTLLANNYYPLAANTQVYLVDGTNATIDSLFERRVQIPPAVTDAAGNLLKASTARDSIRLTPLQLSELLQTTRLQGQARFNVPDANSETLELDASRAIRFQLVGDFKLRVAAQ